MLLMALISNARSFSFKCTLTPVGNTLSCPVSLSHHRYTYTHTDTHTKAHTYIVLDPLKDVDRPAGSQKDR